MNRLCKCGCMKPVIWNERKNRWNIYICGHNVRDPKTRKKISKVNRGQTWEENYGLDKAKRMRKKLSKIRKGKTWEEIYGIEKARELRRRARDVLIDRKPTKETKRKMRKAAKKNWQNPEYKERQLKAISAGMSNKPTKPERRLRKGLNKLFPGEYRYVGDGTTFIGGKCPDFINVNGQKKIIEMFGNFWHGKKYRSIAFNDNSSNKEHEQQRIKHFAKYGFKTLIVWQKELMNISKLKRKLRIFNEV